MELSALADICQLLVVAIMLFGYVPQWVTLVRAGSAAGQSLSGWGIWLCGSLLAWFYSMVLVLEHHTGYLLLLTNSLNVLFTVITTILVSRYRIVER